MRGIGSGLRLRRLRQQDDGQRGGQPYPESWHWAKPHCPRSIRDVGGSGSPVEGAEELANSHTPSLPRERPAQLPGPPIWHWRGGAAKWETGLETAERVARGEGPAGGHRHSHRGAEGTMAQRGTAAAAGQQGGLAG